MSDDLEERLKVIWDDGAVHLSFSLCGETIADGDRRMRAVAKVLRRWAQKLGGGEIEAAPGSICFRCFTPDRKTFSVSADRLRLRVKQILTAPLTPEDVDRVLAITARERLRWYKDGRLPTCGRGVVGKGNHQVGFPLFPVDAITRLAAAPEIIASWRADDESDCSARKTKGFDRLV